MGPELESRLRRVEDLLEIQQLFIDYGMHLDAGRFEDYAALFATDGEIRLGPMGRAKGRIEIRDTMTRALDGLVGKTFHVTGWKIGTVCAPAPLTVEFRKVHQYTVFTANSAMQHGLAEHLGDPTPYLTLPAFYQAKRDRFAAGLRATPLRLLPCEGSYFQCASYAEVAELRDLTERECSEWLTREIGVTPIPLSAFCSTPTERQTIRFCFAKRDATLDAALVRLGKLGTAAHHR